MQVKHRNSTIYRDGNVEITFVTESEIPRQGGTVRCAVDVYYLEINDETKRMNADEFASLKRIMKAIMGIEE